jgi:hypothetical protein
MTYGTQEQLANRIRSDLAWLSEFGYVEDKAILASGCSMWFKGPRGEIVVSIGRGQFEIWLTPLGRPRAQMQSYLKAHGLGAPRSLYLTGLDTAEGLDSAFREQFGALELLRDSEVAGNSDVQPWRGTAQVHAAAHRRDFEQVTSRILARVRAARESEETAQPEEESGDPSGQG